MKRKFLLPVLALISAAGLFLGCSADIDTETVEASLTLNASQLSISDAVATVTQTTLTAFLSGSNASVKWTSSDSSIVAVTNDSSKITTITAMGAGTARVVATTSDGKLSASSKVTVTLGKTPAHPVTNLAVDSNLIKENSITLSWTDSADLTSVKIVCVKTDDSTIMSTTSVSKGLQTASITGLKTNKTGIEYTFNVYAVINGVISTVSSVSAVTLPDTTPPANVANLTVAAVTDHTLTLTWTDPADDDFSNVIITSSGTLLDGSSITDVSVDKGVCTATYEKLSSDTAYTFVLKTKDVNDNVSNSVSVTKTTSVDTTAPGKVTSVATESTRTTIKLTWKDPADIDLKSIVISAASDDAGAAVPSDITVAAGTCTATMTGLTLDATYTFTLTAKDISGNAGTGVTVNAPTVKPFATNISAVTQYTGQILVTWTDTTVAETGVTYTYNATAVPSTTTNGETSVSQTGIAAGTQKAVFSGLTVGTTYTFSVATVPSDVGTYTAVTTPSVKPVNVYWRIYNTYKLAGVSDSSYMLVPNIQNSTYEVAMGTAAERTSANITYEYWLVVPSIADSTSVTDFSLEVLDTDKNETGYYMYLDPSRTLPSSALQYNKWGFDSSGVTYASFVAKVTDSYLKDNLAYAAFKLKSDKRTVNSYTCNAFEWGYDSTLTLYATYLNTFGKSGYSGTNNDYFWYIKETY